MTGAGGNVRLRSALRRWSDEDLESLIHELRQDHFVTRIYGPHKKWQMLATALSEKRRRVVADQYGDEALFT